jgi:hypothetical protein
MRSRIRIPLLTVLLTGVLAAAGRGQIRPVLLGQPPAFEDFGASGQNVALLPDGRFATVWTRGDQGNVDVYLQFVHPDGTLQIAPPGQPVAASAASEGGAVVVPHAQEGVLVAWLRANPVRQPNNQIVVQWLDGQGRPRWGDGVVAAIPGGREYHLSPFLLASPDGGAFVCFLRKQSLSPFLSNVYCQRFAPDGRRLWGKNGARASSINQSAEPPQMVPDGAGGILVFWRDDGVHHTRNESGGYRGQRLGLGGRPLWGAEGKILHKTRSRGSFLNPVRTVVPDGSGGAVVALDDQSGSPIIDDRDVIVQRVDNTGRGLWGDGVAVASGPALQYLDSLVPGPDGGAFVGVFTIGDGGGLAFHRLGGDGSLLWPAGGVPVDPATGGGSEYGLSSFGAFDGEALRFVWEHVSGQKVEIRFGALDSDGKRLSAAGGVPLTDLKENLFLAGFAFDPGSGASFAIWADYIDFNEAHAMGALYTLPR